MSAPDLFLHLRAAGFTLDVEGGALLVAPASKLTDDLRDAVRASKAELMAAVLDRADDLRVTCNECGFYRPWRCGNYRYALLSTPDVGADLAALPQWCPGFEPVR